MTRVRVPVSCLLALGLLLSLPASAGARGPSAEMIAEINEVRAKHGLRALRHAPSLGRSARRYGRTMMARDHFGHANRIRAPRRFRRLGEALAYERGSHPAVSRTLQGWLRSPAHRALVLSRSFRYAGAGLAKGRFRGHRTTMWVLHLGAR